MENSKPNFIYPTRITMLDANTLDSEIFNILKLQLQTVLEIIPPWIWKQYETKLDIILHYLIWRLSVHKFRGTFGQQLLNMKYLDCQLTPNKERLILFSRILSYLHSTDSLSSSSAPMNKIIKVLDIAFRIFELGNLLLFFHQGRYSTVTDRLLNLRLVCIVNKPRSIGYNYMTRELLWHGFMELITLTLSVVNYQYIRRKFARIFSNPSKLRFNVRSLNQNIDGKCAICGKDPILPQHMGCSHIFCYYCIQTNRSVDSRYECPSCFFFQEKIDFVHY